MVYQTGSSVKELSSEYGVSEVTIYKWIKKFSPINLEGGASVTPDDFAKLQKQIRRLQEENEILKNDHIGEKVSSAMVRPKSIKSFKRKAIKSV